MPKLNSKGFAISTILYGILMLASLTLFLIVSTIVSSKKSSDSFIKNIEDGLNDSITMTCKDNTLSEQLICGLGTNGTVYEPTPGGTKYIRSATTSTAPHLVNNYVWWSGMMWRIYAINPDGSMKIITDDNVSALPFHNQNGPNVYATSHMKQWLETYFYPKLNSSKDTVLKQNNDFCMIVQMMVIQLVQHVLISYPI